MRPKLKETVMISKLFKSFSFKKGLVVVRKTTSEIMQHFRDSDLRWVAGSLAYSTVLSLVPFVVLTLAVFQMIGGLETLEPIVQSLFLQYFREAVGSEASQILKKILTRVRPEALGLTSLFFLIFTSLRLLQDIESGISSMWSRTTSRPLLKKLLVSWIFLVFFTGGLAVYTGFRSLDFLKPIVNTQRELLDYTVVILGLFGIYKYLPPAKVRSRSAVISALIAGLGLMALQSSFALITKKFFTFSKIYGSLATIPLLLMWVLFVWYVILAGAALTASLDKSQQPVSKK